MADTDLVATLKSVDLFSGLRKRTLESIAGVARVVEHAAGREIVTEESGGVGFHLILDGTAVVDLHGQERRRLKPGEYFGEISLIDGKPRSATVRAETPLRTLSLSAWHFHPLLEQHAEIAQVLLLKLCERLRAAEVVPAG